MAEKFDIDAEVVRPGTVAGWSRHLPAWAVALRRVTRLSSSRSTTSRATAAGPTSCAPVRARDRRRGAHSAGRRRAARPAAPQLVTELATDPQAPQSLTLATPHSGVEAAFRSLLTLLDPAFADLAADRAARRQRSLRRQLAQHLVQRRRADIRSLSGGRDVFPERQRGKRPTRSARVPEALQRCPRSTPASWCATTQGAPRTASVSAGGLRWPCCAASARARCGRGHLSAPVPPA